MAIFSSRFVLFMIQIPWWVQNRSQRAAKVPAMPSETRKWIKWSIPLCEIETGYQLKVPKRVSAKPS